MSLTQMTPIHINDIRPGDVIERNGKLVTVCGKDITFSTFMGRAIFGDCYALGAKPVMRADFLRK